MIYNIRKAFAILSMVILGSVFVYNCEPEPDSLGEQLFLDDAANGNESSFDLIAYNLSNNDTIRADAANLYNLFGSSALTTSTAVLGAFSEGQFGMQKASYFTQLRLPSYDPDFGTNAEVDSVVLVIKPVYASDSLTTNTDESYVYPDGNVDAKKVVNTYPALKYGKAKKKLTINVQEVTEFMNGYNDVVYSNKNFGTDTQLLGSREFSGNVSSVAITKDSDNSSLFTSAVGFRIPLSKTFFQDKIINKKGQPELKDAANFIRHIKGLKLSVTESDGYLFQFYPNDMELVMYYKNDKTENGTTTRPQSTYKFSLGSGNVHTGYYQYDRSTATQYIAAGNETTGDLKLYAQGMGGNSIGVKFPEATINQLKELYQTKKAAIITAKIRIYTDQSTWSNAYAKPAGFTIVQRKADNKTPEFTADYTSLGAIGTFIPIRAYDLDKNPAYYDFTVTQSLKNIIESQDSAVNSYKDKYFKIDLGSFVSSATTSALVGPTYTTRAFTMQRAVFVGSDPANENRIQLRVTYGTK